MYVIIIANEPMNMGGATRHGGNTAYPKVKNKAFHLSYEIHKNGQAKTTGPQIYLMEVPCVLSQVGLHVEHYPNPTWRLLL